MPPSPSPPIFNNNQQHEGQEEAIGHMKANWDEERRRWLALEEELRSELERSRIQAGDERTQAMTFQQEIEGLRAQLVEAEGLRAKVEAEIRAQVELRVEVLEGRILELNRELEKAEGKMKDLSAASSAALEEMRAKLTESHRREKEEILAESKQSLASSLQALESKLNNEWAQRCDDLEVHIERLKGEVEAKGKEAIEAIAQRDLHWKEEIGARAGKLHELERRAEDDRWV